MNTFSAFRHRCRKKEKSRSPTVHSATAIIWTIRMEHKLHCGPCLRTNRNNIMRLQNSKGHQQTVSSLFGNRRCSRLTVRFWIASGPLQEKPVSPTAAFSNPFGGNAAFPRRGRIRDAQREDFADCGFDRVSFRAERVLPEPVRRLPTSPGRRPTPAGRHQQCLPALWQFRVQRISRPVCEPGVSSANLPRRRPVQIRCATPSRIRAAVLPVR